MAPLRLASFKANDRTSYGAVTDGGIVDLGRKLSRYPTLLDVFRAGAFGEAKAAANDAGTISSRMSRCCRRSLRRRRSFASASIIRSAPLNTNAAPKDPPKYPNLFCRFPSSLVGTDVPIVRPKVSDKFDYEGELVLVMGKEGRHIPTDKALVLYRRAHARQRRQRARLAAPRLAQHHPGQELRRVGQPRSVGGADRRRRSGKAAAASPPRSTAKCARTTPPTA